MVTTMMVLRRQAISQFPPFFSSPLLPQRLNFAIPFHQFAAPSPPPQNPLPSNLLNHKDWLSPPQVIRMFQSLDDPNLALPLLEQLSRRKDYKPNEALYSTLIHKLSVSRNFHAVETLMRTIKINRRCRLSDKFFRNLIRVYAHEARRVDKAVETLFDMPNYKCWPTTATFNVVLNALVSSKRLDVAHEVFVKGCSELGVEVDACCFNILIKGLCECGEVEAACRVLDEFPEQGCRSNARTFSTLMHGLCERGRVDEAFGLLERMEREGVEVDAVVFNVLISGLRKRGRFDEGVRVLEKVVMSKGCSPNPGTYQEVLYCLLDAKRFREAKGFMGKMTDKGMRPSFESYKMVLHGFCSEDHIEDAEWALREMVGHGFVPKMGMWKQIVLCVLLDNYGVLSFGKIISEG